MTDLLLECLESRLVLTAPSPPLIIEPETEGQVVSNFDVHMEIDPASYFDMDGHAHFATSWQIRETPANGGAAVWQALTITDALSKYHIHFGDGQFVGTLAGKSELLFSRNYQLHVSVTDTNSETSAASIRNFTTSSQTAPVPGAGTWIARAGYTVEVALAPGAFRLPVNIAFVPNPGPNPNDPLYYVTELYGSIKVVRRNGTVSDYATGLLDYNPSGPISGVGEQGLTGIAVDPASGDLYVGMLWDNGNPPGGTVHYPKVERLQSNDGGLTMATRTVLLNMQPETQGQSHQISNLSIGPDGKLYVHMGDGFDASTALNLNQYRGKVLRMNLNGTAPTDNPFFNAANGINSQDYVFTYGHRNPFGGAWRASNGKHWIVENGNGLDRMVDLTASQSYGWSGSDQALIDHSKFIWNPATAPVNIAFIQSQTFGGSLFPASVLDDAYVSLSGPTYAAGPQARGKRIEQFPDLDTLVGGKLAAPPITLVRYNGTGRATISGLAAGPDGLYFTDLYRDDGVGGATAVGANVYRVRYVGFHPHDVTASPANGQITLNWETDPLATSYNVYRRTSGGSYALLQGGVVGSSLVDATVTNGTQYFYVVRGVNAGGESEDSNEVSAIPGAGSQPPTVVNPAAATPNPVLGTTVSLSVLGDDDEGEANLRYTWLAVTKPPGAANPAFTINGTNAAKNTAATLFKAGEYLFRVTILDQDGGSVTSTVMVQVNQTLTSAVVTPGTASITSGGSQQFFATTRDQFGDPMASQPSFTWSLGPGDPGTINATGLYSAPNTLGFATVIATTGGFEAKASISLVAAGHGLATTFFDNLNHTGIWIAGLSPVVDFDWATGSPHPSIGADTFSSRWTGRLLPRYSETYTIFVTGDDGIRLWIDEVLVIDQWIDQGPTTYAATLSLAAGLRYSVRLEHYENGGAAFARLEWQSASQAREVVPASRLFSDTSYSAIRVNFQDLTSQGYPVYFADTGVPFGVWGNGFKYGWNADNSLAARNRNSANSPDERYDTLTHMQKPENPNAFWEIAIPNGKYVVRVVSGDPSGALDAFYHLLAEGQTVINGAPSANQMFFEGQVVVTVLDGRLTISNGPNSSNNKINFVEIFRYAVEGGKGGGARSFDFAALDPKTSLIFTSPTGRRGRVPFGHTGRNENWGRQLTIATNWFVESVSSGQWNVGQPTPIHEISRSAPFEPIGIPNSTIAFLRRRGGTGVEQNDR